MNGFANAQVGATAANISRHGFINILICRIWIFTEQHGRRHQLTGMTISTLRNVDLLPGKLRRMIIIGRKTLDRYDFLPFSAAYFGNTGTYRFTIQMNHAGSTLRDAATVLGPGQADNIADHP